MSKYIKYPVPSHQKAGREVVSQIIGGMTPVPPPQPARKVKPRVVSQAVNRASTY